MLDIYNMWSVIEYLPDEVENKRSYERLIEIHRESYYGDDAQEIAEQRAKVLKSKGLNVTFRKILPIRKSLPYSALWNSKN